jgi:DNA polymerase-3 subunit delta'
MNIIGHQRILEFLERSLKTGKISHAYLFYGPENLGKSLVAEYFARLLLGISQNDNSELSLHQDFISLAPLSGKTNISIDQIRELQKTLLLRPILSSFKVAILDGAEKMTDEAANSFLKFLEEPPSYVVLILIVSKLHRLPPTIFSRCQIIKFNPVPINEIKKSLIQNYHFNQEEASSLAKLSFGRPGLIIRFLDEKVFSSFKDNVKDFISLFSKNFFERVEMIGEEEETMLDVWEIAAHDIFLAQFGLSPSLFFNTSEINKLAKELSKETIIKFLDNLLLTKKYFSVNLNKRLALENLLLNI